MPGPIPKRSEERTRRNAAGEDGIELKKGEAQPYSWTRADPDWDEPTRDFYYSFRKSGMAAYFQQTDVQWLWLACDELARYRAMGKQSAMLLGSIIQMLNSGFGITEGERRRLKIELDVPQEAESDEVNDKVVQAKNRFQKPA